MTVSTLGALIEAHGVDVLGHLDRSMEVPVVAGLQFQGDLAVIPRRPVTPGAGDGPAAVPQAGIAVIEAVGGGHEHRLLGEAVFGLSRGGGQDIGVVVVPEGGEAFLAHPEHGYLGIGPGCYVLRRQREQADEERLVAD